MLRANLKREQARIEAELATIDTRIRTQAPEYYALIRPEPLGAAQAQALLGPDEAVLMVVPTDFGTQVMAVTHDDLRWTQTDLKEDQVQAMVTKLRHDLDPGGAVRAGEGDSAAVSAGGRSYDRKTAFALYQALVAPMEPALAGKRHVFIAAAGPLASLPFGVLVTQAPQGDDADPAALRATQWFADAHALVQIANLQSLQFVRRFNRGQARGTGFAGFGDPVLAGGHRTAPLPQTAALAAAGRSRDGGMIADGAKLSALPSLPGTRRELEGLRTALGAPVTAVKLGPQATEAAVRSADLRQVRVLAFATHGLMAGQAGASEPGLVFTPPAQPSDGDDGLLTASEITTLKLGADWVILSACNTAAGDGADGSGLAGLARAFFYAGAHSLLASHWRVRDDVAAVLTADAIQRQQADPRLSRAEALQAAMRAVRNDPKDPSRAHPGAWAPFVLVGDAR